MTKFGKSLIQAAKEARTIARETAPIPTAISDSEIRIGDLTLKVVQLDDGRRIIPEEDMAKFLEWLNSEPSSE